MQITEQYLSSLILKIKQKETDLKKIPVKECKVCGSEMIKRHSKFSDGFWWGCGRWPNCKYTEKDNK